MFVRVVKGSSKKYVLIVRSFRDKDGKPRQETVLNLGPVNASNEDETVALAKRMIANLGGEQIIINGEDIQEVLRQNWGAPAIMEQLWHCFNMDAVITGTKADAIKLMMMDRLISPSSKLSTYNNRQYYQGVKDIDLNQLYRSLDYLADHSDEIKKHTYNRQKLRGVFDVVFFDVTTLYFESQKADLLREFGYSKDCKFNEVQIVLCLLIDANGRPLSYELFPGNTFEGATLIPSLQRLYQEFNIKKLIIVADRGIGSKVNLQAIKEAGYDYIVGAKLRGASKKLQEDAIAADGFLPLGGIEDAHDSRQYKVIKNADQDWVILHSSKRAQKDKSDRVRLIEKAKEMLDKGSTLDNKRGAKKFIKSSAKESASLSLDEDKILYESKFDGYYALSFSDKNLSAEMIANAYHGLWMIEENFRTLKSFFEVRPIFHWSKKRIEGHILMNFILLVMENYLLEACRKVDQSLSHNVIRSCIAGMQVSTLRVDTCHFASYSANTDQQLAICKAMNITQPKNHKIIK